MSGIIGVSPNMKSGVLGKLPTGTKKLVARHYITTVSSGTTAFTDESDAYGHTVAFDSVSWSATSGTIYMIDTNICITMFHLSGTGGSRPVALYYGTTDRSQGGTSVSGDVKLDGATVGSNLVASTETDRIIYSAMNNFRGTFTAGSTATHYAHITVDGNSDCRAGATLAPNGPLWSTHIYELAI